MSQGTPVNSAKFASITPDLVVRKGEARPWPQHDSPIHPLARDDEDPLEADEIAPEPHASVDGIRRCTLKLSPCEYERLGIIAVKRNTSRQQILRLAVEEYLAAIEHEYGKSCGCLGGQNCRSEKPRLRTF